MMGRPTGNQDAKQKAEDMPVTICVLKGETDKKNQRFLRRRKEGGGLSL